MYTIEERAKLGGRGIHFLLVTTVACVFIFTNLWPVSWMIEWQTKHFDGYFYPKTTFIIFFAVVFVVLLPLLTLISRLLLRVLKNKK